MVKNKRNNKAIIKRIADTRMNYLFQKAHDIFPNDKELANRYTYLARRYAQRAKIRIPKINCRTRIHSKGKGSHVSTTCLDCNHTTRYFIKLN